MKSSYLSPSPRTIVVDRSQVTYRVASSLLFEKDVEFPAITYHNLFLVKDRAFADKSKAMERLRQFLRGSYREALVVREKHSWTVYYYNSNFFLKEFPESVRKNTEKESASPNRLTTIVKNTGKRLFSELGKNFRLTT